MEFVVVLTTLIATIVGSISGIGGGVLIKPVLDAVSDMSSSQISFLSGTTVLTMTVVSLLRTKDVKNNVTIRTLFLGFGAAIGGVLGKRLFEMIKHTAGNDSMVGLVQNIVMVLLTVAVFIYTLNKSKISTKDVKSKILTLFVGLLLGVISSFLGIGGGPINLMVLSYFFSMDSKTAALNSLATILLSQTLSMGVTAVKGLPEVSLILLASMCLTGVVGATIGRKLSVKMDNKAVDKLFLCLMGVIIGLSIYNCIKFSH